MLRVIKTREMDRPTHHTLQYLTKVKPHLLDKEPFLVDPFVKESLTDLIGGDVVEEFGEYTRSYYTLEGHYYNLWNYDRAILPRPNDPILTQAISLAARAFTLPMPVYSISWDNLAAVPFIPSSSAGWGYVGKKGAPGNHEKAINRAVSSLNWWLETMEGLTTRPFRYRPDLAWTRTQLGTIESPKIRHVWGEAFENVILEGMSAAPLIKEYQALGEPMTIGIHMYKRLPLIIQKALATPHSTNYGVGLDVKSFDASVQPWLIDEAFNIIEQNLLFRTWMERAAFQYTKHFFVHRPVVMPDGRMWLKHVGVPSGSYYTQLIDSIANLIAVYYSQLKLYGTTFQTWVLGDDSLFGVPVEYGPPDPSHFSPHFEALGFKLSEHKCIVAIHPDQLVYLGHTARGTRVSRETADMMRLALYPEYPVTGPAHSIARIKGLLLDSGLTNWPILHLHDYMMSQHRINFEASDVDFGHENANWLSSVMNLTTKPKDLDLVKAWTIT